MKKVLLLVGFIVSSALTINAQDISENAIGLRLVSDDGFGN